MRKFYRNRENLSQQRLTDPNMMAGGVLDTVISAKQRTITWWTARRTATKPW